MSSRLQRFYEAMNNTDPHVGEKGETMKVLFLIMYSSETKVGQVNFDQFAFEAAERALEEIINYQADDTVEDDFNANEGNLIIELNRLAHVQQLASNVPSVGPRRRFY